MAKFRTALVAAMALALSGCVAKTAAAVVKAPVKLASGAVDLATPSQSERDEKRGRDLRKTQEKLRSMERDRAKQVEKCRKGDGSACDKAESLDRQMADLRRAMAP
jgi:hypothetical protein